MHRKNTPRTFPGEKKAWLNDLEEILKREVGFNVMLGLLVYMF